LLSLRGTTLVDINLLKAVAAGDQDTAVILINNGANLNFGYEDGCCPIIKSANFNYEKIMKALIANGADLNRRSDNGNTGNYQFIFVESTIYTLV
jgi:ankyrin repeat protein